MTISFLAFIRKLTCKQFPEGVGGPVPSPVLPGLGQPSARFPRRKNARVASLSAPPRSPRGYRVSPYATNGLHSDPAAPAPALGAHVLCLSCASNRRGTGAAPDERRALDFRKLPKNSGPQFMAKLRGRRARSHGERRYARRFGAPRRQPAVGCKQLPAVSGTQPLSNVRPARSRGA